MSLKWIIALLLFALTGASVFLAWKGINIIGINTGAILFGFVVAYLVFSFTILNGKEQGAEEDLGRPTKNRGPG
ncbi:hypothetical protein K2P96_00205, partial [Patescibacteria group bacterium]|nr:hypothetical protein [Patescibacteria group bacterium]